MNYLDVIILLPLCWGAFIGFKKGLIIEIATLLGIGLGIYGASEFSTAVAEWLSTYVDWSFRLVRLISFALTFIGIVVLIQLAGRGIEKLIKLAALGMFNRLAGSVFGVLKYALLLALVVYLLDKANSRYPFISDELRQESLLYETMSGLIPALYPGFESLGSLTD